MSEPGQALALAESPDTAVLTHLIHVVVQNVQDNVLTPRTGAGGDPRLVQYAAAWSRFCETG
jgi:hypothetical protein